MIQRILDEGKIIALVLILITGFWGIIITFSDYPATWSRATWLVYLAAWHVPSAFLVGFVVPERWYLSLFVAWGAAAMLLLFSLPYLLGLIFLPIVGAGYLGSVVSKGRTRRKSTAGS